MCHVGQPAVQDTLKHNDLKGVSGLHEILLEPSDEEIQRGKNSGLFYSLIRFFFFFSNTPTNI